MDNNIIEILDIKDTGIKILSVKETNTTRTVTIEKELSIHYCDLCGCRMHVKDIYRRHVNHPIMQDGLNLVLIINQRRWKCDDSCNIRTTILNYPDRNPAISGQDS